MTTATRNGTARKNLADQIDRLDRTLDGLAIGLNEAVANATREAVQQTLQGVLMELMTNPDLAQLLQGSANQTRPHTDQPVRPTDQKDDRFGGRPGFFQRVWAKTRQTVQAVCGGVGVGALFLVAGGKYLAGRIKAGLNWLWDQAKVLAGKAVSLVSRPVLAAWSFVRGLLSSYSLLAPWTI